MSVQPSIGLAARSAVLPAPLVGVRQRPGHHVARGLHPIIWPPAPVCRRLAPGKHAVAVRSLTNASSVREREQSMSVPRDDGTTDRRKHMYGDERKNAQMPQRAQRRAGNAPERPPLY